MLETLTETRTGAQPAARQRAICWQAWSRLQAPSMGINPRSSATGMKSLGLTSPSSALFQRISASRPAAVPVARSIFGW